MYQFYFCIHMVIPQLVKKACTFVLVVFLLALLSLTIFFVKRSDVSFDSRSSAFVPSSPSIIIPLTEPSFNCVNQVGDLVASPDNDLAWIGNGNSRSESYLGLRFTNITIDPAREIDEVFLEFFASTSQNDRSDLSTLDINITAEKGMYSEPFSKQNPPSKRPEYEKVVNYRSSTRWSSDTKNYINVTGLVNKIYDYEKSPSTITLIIKGESAARARRYFYTDEARSPRLVVTYAPSISN
jgi:hypothetical protein